MDLPIDPGTLGSVRAGLGALQRDLQAAQGAASAEMQTQQRLMDLKAQNLKLAEEIVTLERGATERLSALRIGVGRAGERMAQEAREARTEAGQRAEIRAGLTMETRWREWRQGKSLDQIVDERLERSMEARWRQWRAQRAGMGRGDEAFDVGPRAFWARFRGVSELARGDVTPASVRDTMELGEDVSRMAGARRAAAAFGMGVRAMPAVAVGVAYTRAIMEPVIEAFKSAQGVARTAEATEQRLARMTRFTGAQARQFGTAFREEAIRRDIAERGPIAVGAWRPWGRSGAEQVREREERVGKEAAQVEAELRNVSARELAAALERETGQAVEIDEKAIQTALSKVLLDDGARERLRAYLRSKAKRPEPEMRAATRHAAVLAAREQRRVEGLSLTPRRPRQIAPFPAAPEPPPVPVAGAEAQMETPAPSKSVLTMEEQLAMTGGDEETMMGPAARARAERERREALTIRQAAEEQDRRGQLARSE